jgi:heme/copper-type cytochrome/quinol oxidase subunit 4
MNSFTVLSKEMNYLISLLLIIIGMILSIFVGLRNKDEETGGLTTQGQVFTLVGLSFMVTGFLIWYYQRPKGNNTLNNNTI